MKSLLYYVIIFLLNFILISKESQDHKGKFTFFRYFSINTNVN